MTSPCIRIVVFGDNSKERGVGVGKRLNGSHATAFVIVIEIVVSNVVIVIVFVIIGKEVNDNNFDDEDDDSDDGKDDDSDDVDDDDKGEDRSPVPPHLSGLGTQLTRCWGLSSIRS